MTIKWSVAASAELENIITYLHDYAPEVAQGFIDRLLVFEKNLAVFPRAGLYDQETDTYDRFLTRTRIVITYRVSPDQIEIIYVWHTSKDPQAKNC